MDRQAKELEKQILMWHRDNEASRKLEAIPGIGPAWMGLVPKQHSSGGKQNLLGISRRGDTDLRTLMIHGARAVIRFAESKSHEEGWLRTLMAATPVRQDSLALMMQWLGARYVRYINHSYRRTGSLWEGRYKGCLVDSDRYLLTCMCYIELNPLRAGMVESPADYRWSSYHCNAFGSVDRLTQPHPLYTALGEDAEVRQRVYRGLFQGRGDPALIDEIRAATHTGTPLGNDRFREKIEAALGGAVGQLVRGRPKKLNAAR